MSCSLSAFSKFSKELNFPSYKVRRRSDVHRTIVYQPLCSSTSQGPKANKEKTEWILTATGQDPWPWCVRRSWQKSCKADSQSNPQAHLQSHNISSLYHKWMHIMQPHKGMLCFVCNHTRECFAYTTTGECFACNHTSACRACTATRVCNSTYDSSRSLPTEGCISCRHQRSVRWSIWLGVTQFD